MPAETNAKPCRASDSDRPNCGRGRPVRSEPRRIEPPLPPMTPTFRHRVGGGLLLAGICAGDFAVLLPGAESGFPFRSGSQRTALVDLPPEAR